MAQRAIGVYAFFLMDLLAIPVASAVQVQAPVDFGTQIRPILEAHCFACHSQNRQESNYRLDSRERALGIADRGETAIVAGQADESPLYHLITGAEGERMPPEDEAEPLSAAEINLIRRWIDEGAVWPDEFAGDSHSRPVTDHWSFALPREPDVPDSEAGDAIRSSPEMIDLLVGRGLAKHGLSPSAEAERVILIRRIYLVMLGLLPTSEQVENFVNDSSPDAWDRVVESVLGSPHYGERWARHWLDVVRFGESTGFEVNRDRSNAWWYRDYVIEAFNSDKPYDQFIREQLAGDVLGVDEATGFLVGGAHDIVKSPDPGLTLMQRQDELSDYVNTTCTSFLGLTVACARCHDHKFDPILQRDYFALQGFFTGIRHGERPLLNKVSAEVRERQTGAGRRLEELESRLKDMAASVPPDESAASYLMEAVNARMNSDPFDPVEARYVRFLVHRANQFEPCLDELEIWSKENLNVALASSGAVATSSGDYSGHPKHQLAHVNDGQFGNERSWIASTETGGWVQIDLGTTRSIQRVDWGRDRLGEFSDRLAIEYEILISQDGEKWTAVSSSNRRKPFLIDGKEPEEAFIPRLPESQQPVARELLNEVRQLREELKKIEADIPAAYVGTFESAEAVYRLHRGDPMSPRERVYPDVLSVTGSLELQPDLAEPDLRLALASWIASPDNPLTARVMANRIWQHHFGRGIVATPSDFGVNGIPPTHPELLNWLALRLVENGWSLKDLHRLILRSRTWRQASTPHAAGLQSDADNRLLWRFPPRRLEAECIRDCILQVSGKLNPRRGGPGFLLFRVDRENVHHYFPLVEFSEDEFRRMIYMTKIRQEQDDVFCVFDCPDGGQTIPSRNRSTTPLQSLNLYNSSFVNQQAAFLAAACPGDGTSPSSRICEAFRRVYLREPDAGELAGYSAFVNEFGMDAFCRALLNSNEFLFLY